MIFVFVSDIEYLFIVSTFLGFGPPKSILVNPYGYFVRVVHIEYVYTVHNVGFQTTASLIKAKDVLKYGNGVKNNCTN